MLLCGALEMLVASQLVILFLRYVDVCVCVYVAIHLVIVSGCDNFQLDVHYESILETPFGFRNPGDIVCVSNVMLIQLVMYLAVYAPSGLCRSSRDRGSMKAGRECRPGCEDTLSCGVLEMLVVSQSVTYSQF